MSIKAVATPRRRVQVVAANEKGQVETLDILGRVDFNKDFSQWTKPKKIDEVETIQDFEEKNLRFRFFHATKILDTYEPNKGALDHYVSKYFKTHPQIGSKGNF
jgi:hypothetical protein